MGKEAPFYKNNNILRREGQKPSRFAICKALLPPCRYRAKLRLFHGLSTYILTQ